MTPDDWNGRGARPGRKGCGCASACDDLIQDVSMIARHVIALADDPLLHVLGSSSQATRDFQNMIGAISRRTRKLQAHVEQARE